MKEPSKADFDAMLEVGLRWDPEPLVFHHCMVAMPERMLEEHLRECPGKSPNYDRWVELMREYKRRT